MNNPKTRILWLVSAALIGLAIYWFLQSKPRHEAAEPTQSPMSNATSLDNPATCSLEGEVRFVNRSTAINDGNKIVYSGVDFEGNNIYWTITPFDGLRVGPDFFEQIPIPDGESAAIVTLPESPKYDEYTITANMDYGRVVDGILRQFNVECERNIKVILEYKK